MRPTCGHGLKVTSSRGRTPSSVPPRRLFLFFATSVSTFQRSRDTKTCPCSVRGLPPRSPRTSRPQTGSGGVKQRPLPFGDTSPSFSYWYLKSGSCCLLLSCPDSRRLESFGRQICDLVESHALPRKRNGAGILMHRGPITALASCRSLARCRRLPNRQSCPLGNIYVSL